MHNCEISKLHNLFIYLYNCIKNIKNFMAINYNNKWATLLNAIFRNSPMI